APGPAESATAFRKREELEMFSPADADIVGRGGGRAPVPAHELTDETAALWFTFLGHLPRTSSTSQFPRIVKPYCRTAMARCTLHGNVSSLRLIPGPRGPKESR